MKLGSQRLCNAYSVAFRGEVDLSLMMGNVHELHVYFKSRRRPPARQCGPMQSDAHFDRIHGTGDQVVMVVELQLEALLMCFSPEQRELIEKGKAEVKIVPERLLPPPDGYVEMVPPSVSDAALVAEMMADLPQQEARA